MNDVNIIKVYACGGLGLNVVGNHVAMNNNEAGDAESGFAEIEVSYMDTSTANITSAMAGKFYHFKNMSGSGKDRGMNARAINDWIDHAVEEHQPREFNIVVHSLTGGSGSVIGPILVKRLLEEGKSVVVLAALSDTSLQELDNAKGTIGTYENMAKVSGSPIVIKAYMDGDQKRTDEMVISDLAHLRGLFSGVNQAMDTMDLKNWLKYSGKSVKMTPRLYLLDIYGGGRTMTEPALSVAALAATNNITPPVSVAYLTTGIPPQSWFEGSTKLIDKSPVFYAISDSAGDVYEKLEGMVAENTKKFTANRTRGRSIDIAGADDTGIVI